MKESKVVEFKDNSLATRTEVAKTVIDIQNKILQVKIDEARERRALQISLERKIKEVKLLALGNKNDIKELYRRSNDNIENIEKIQGYIHWTVKAIMGVIITIIITSVLQLMFS